MTATARDAELAALRRPFAVALGVVALVVVAIGAVVAAYGSTADRPAGIAERWLVAVGDTTRDGVEEDARHRLEELSVDVPPPDVVASLVGRSPTAADERESAFETVRVGPPLEDDHDRVTVPAELVPRDGERVRIHLALVRTADGWAVQGPSATGDGLDGFPIERPERAPIGWFLGALGLGVVITLGCVAAVRAATPRPA